MKSAIDRLLDEGGHIRSDEELAFIEDRIDDYLRLRRRLKTDEAEDRLLEGRERPLEAHVRPSSVFP